MLVLLRCFTVIAAFILVLSQAVAAHACSAKSDSSCVKECDDKKAESAERAQARFAENLNGEDENSFTEELKSSAGKHTHGRHGRSAMAREKILKE